MKRIGFTFFNGIHHIFHSIPLACELAKSGACEVTLLSCSSEHTQILQKVTQKFGNPPLEIKTLALPFRYKYFNFKGKTYPSPYNTVRNHKKLINSFDALIGTSHDLKKLCDKYNINHPKVIYISHGCGDRAYGFKNDIKGADFILLPGSYYEQRFMDNGIIKDTPYKVIGYAKFDIPHTPQKEIPLFPESRPTILYSPHWDPKLSSFKLWGKNIFKFFAERSTWNVIFAPHILIKHWKKRYSYDFETFSDSHTHIKVDWGSMASVDTSYLRAADLYLGDVSSQVTEWIALKPRPCLFLNAHGVAWRNDLNYSFWSYGPVVDKFEELDEKLSESWQFDNHYKKKQVERVKNIIYRSDEGPAKLGALAIQEFMDN